MAIDSNSIIKALSVTEKTAIAAYKALGKGDEKNSDKLAVDMMRSVLNSIDIQGKIVIGEGERDKAPMLYIGEKVGTGQGEEVDIALDPLECTSLLANGQEGAMSVLAFSDKGGLLHAPDIYMKKIAIGFHSKENVIDLNNTIEENLKNIAKEKYCKVSELVVSVLDRLRHKNLVKKLRALGVKIRLIKDGDIAAAIYTGLLKGYTDVYMGIGGAPEGVLAAAALKVIGGQMCSKLIFKDIHEEKRAQEMGISDLSRQYFLEDLVSKNVIFSATGITSSLILEGIKCNSRELITNSIIMDSKSSKVMKINSHHKIDIIDFL